MKLILEHLKSASAQAPANDAVICGQKCLSYAELDTMSDNIAAGLQAHGISPGARVGIYMPKSVEAIAAIYATLKAGCCYVPVALENPAPRIMYILENCGIRFVLAATTPASDVRDKMRERDISILGVEHLTAASRQEQNVFTATAPSPHDAAAILHTSGSTGQPKGAVITHANLAVFLAWAHTEFELGPNDRLLSHAPLNFDLSFFDIFAAAAASAAVVLATPIDTANAARLARLVNRSRVTVWQSVPSALTLQAVSPRSDSMPSVRCLLFAGERMPRQSLLRLPQVFPDARLYNVYGCTETNDTFMYALPVDVKEAPDPLPIGTPLPFIRHRIVDVSGRDVALGQEGQLLIAGGTVMAGYLASSRDGSGPKPVYPEEQTTDGFYRTKDIVSVGDDGHLYFHGRADAVIKTNGYRVNLMEIEDHLRRWEKLEEVALLSTPDDLIGNRMVAIVRPRAGVLCSTLDLKLYCAAALPRYAIPHHFHITRDELPKGNTGKVDKRLLTQIWRKTAAGQTANKGATNHECA